ncbi:FmdB family zinc ribbon protein [Sulfurimonas sp.]|uniref:FmdB family zinc ribbon protein n=1 Tax=Sulfurimonas sp. TaxID=2022749 RepID=UPI003568D5B9
MKYNYVCDKCKKDIEVNKPMSESSRDEFCKVCETKMRRIYSAPVIRTADGLRKG